MKIEWILISGLLFFSITGSMGAYVPCLPGSTGDLGSQAENPMIVTLRLDRPKQTIENFGASDCWSAQYVGKWPDSKRNAIADLLFEQGLDEQNRPRGIGLSLWRFNLGAGSNRQTNINDSWRRSDLFLTSDFQSYNWNAQAGQRWFLQAAKTRGCNHYLMFANSPPINMTKNGYAFCDPSIGDTNLLADQYDDFAVFMADVLKHFRDVEGIEFDYISPVNEPQWDWNGWQSNNVWINNQEGCRYSNATIKALIQAMAGPMAERNLSTEILIGEAGSLDYLYGSGSYEGDQIDEFFSTGSANYLGDIVPKKISAHSYWTDLPENGLYSKRNSVRVKCESYGVAYHHTEYCILGDEGPGRDLGIDPALRIARTIHYDLAVGNAVAWQWWLGFHPIIIKTVWSISIKIRLTVIIMIPGCCGRWGISAGLSGRVWCG